MNHEQLKFWRNFFIRLFLLSAGMAAIIFITTELAKDMMINSLGLSEQEFKRDVMNSAVILRVWLLFILLPVALSFHSLLRKVGS